MEKPYGKDGKHKTSYDSILLQIQKEKIWKTTEKKVVNVFSIGTCLSDLILGITEGQ